jgi:hypothetical protein
MFPNHREIVVDIVIHRFFISYLDLQTFHGMLVLVASP